MATLAPSLIEIDDNGRAKLVGSRIKVIHLAGEQRYWGWDAEKIHSEHEHLSLGQVYAALSYYHEHKAELDTEMDRLDAEFDRLYADAVASGRQPSREEFMRRACDLGFTFEREA